MKAGGRRTLVLLAASICLTQFMIAANATMVNVVLPEVKADLDFSAAALSWVMNAYLLALSASLLVAGRLTDVVGRRRTYIWGIVLFSLASILAGVAQSQAVLLTGRVLQGLTAAAMTASQLALCLAAFRASTARTRVLAYVTASGIVGSSLGLLGSGFITAFLDWHWAFLVNVPIGLIAWAMILPGPHVDEGRVAGEKLGLGSALLVGSGMGLLVYAAVRGAEVGLTGPVAALSVAGVVALLGFGLVQARVESPLLPLSLLVERGLVMNSVILAIGSAVLLGQFFIQAQMLAGPYGFDSWQIGLAFLPINLMIIVVSLGLARRLMARVDARILLPAALALMSLGMLWYLRQDGEQSYVVAMLPSLILLGAGGGLASLAATVNAVAWVPDRYAGVGSGFVRMMQQLGGTLGVTIMAGAVAIAVARTGSGAETLSGYRAAFAAGAVLAAIGAALGLFLPRRQDEA